jgi:hypothetical protein
MPRGRRHAAARQTDVAQTAAVGPWSLIGITLKITAPPPVVDRLR